ncbi:MAG: NYN domain-containing protein [Cyanobacteria bacterium P01_B01_bin.77]
MSKSYGGSMKLRAAELQTQKAMVFIDGTNFRYCINGAEIKIIKPIHWIGEMFLEGRQLIRTFFYTCEPHLAWFENEHEQDILQTSKVVLGFAIPTGGGNYSEKGVDVHLVSDMVYHAAMKNYDYALIVTTDQEFVPVIERVQDLGCQTGVLSLFRPVPRELQNMCDEAFSLSKEQLLSNNIGIIDSSSQ